MPYALAALATVALLVALAVDLSASSYHRTGANGSIRNTVVNVPTGERVCQPNQQVEAGTGGVRFYASGRGSVTGPLDVTIAAGSKTLARGRVPARPVGLEQQLAAAVVPPLARGLPEATVCIANRGRRMRVLGEAVPVPGATASLPRAAQPAPYVLITLDFQRAHEESWVAFAPTVAGRYGLVKATFFGTWTFWLAMAALLALAIATIWWIARVVSR